MRQLWLLVLCSSLWACAKIEPRAIVKAEGPLPLVEKTAGLSANLDNRTHPTIKEPRIRPLSVCRSQGRDPLTAARAYYNDHDFDQALSCAAQASAFNPEDPQSHSERAAALSALERYEDAQIAYARALALSPDHLDSLLGAAHLYTVSLPSSRERDDLGLLYSERGL